MINNYTKISSLDKREYFLDFLRIFACILVIVRHVIDNYISYGISSMYDWKVGIMYNSINYTAIQIFIMITGYLMLERIESYNTFFKKLIFNILVPFIFWSFIYQWFGNKYCDMGLDKNFIKLFISKPVYYHLWYVYFIIGVYLLLPLIRKGMKNIESVDLKYLLILWVLFTTVIPLLNLNFGYSIGVTYLFSGFWGYIFIGNYIKRIEVTAKIARIFCIVFIVFYVITAYGSIHFVERGMPWGYLLDAFALNIIILCVSIFIVFKYYTPIIMEYIPCKWRRALIKVSNLTFAIYLIHALVLDVFMRGLLGFKLFPTMVNSIVGIPLLGMLVFIVSLVIVLVISYIPIVKEVV